MTYKYQNVASINFGDITKTYVVLVEGHYDNTGKNLKTLFKKILTQRQVKTTVFSVGIMRMLYVMVVEVLMVIQQ